MKKEVYPPSEDTFFLEDIIKKEKKYSRVAEVGCGSGYITLKLAEKNDYVVATDISFEAASETLTLLKAKGYNAKGDVVCTDGLKPFRPRAFETVYSNPPYLPCPYQEEPLWCGGEKGIEFTLEMAHQSLGVLRDKGRLIFVASDTADVGSLLKRLEKMFAEVKVLRKKKVSLFENLLIVEASLHHCAQGHANT